MRLDEADCGLRRVGQHGALRAEAQRDADQVGVQRGDHGGSEVDRIGAKHVSTQGAHGGARNGCWQGWVRMLEKSRGNGRELVGSRVLCPRRSQRSPEIDDDLRETHRQRDVSELFALYHAGRIRPLVSARYSLEQVSEALHAQMQRKVQGKAVIVP